MRPARKAVLAVGLLTILVTPVVVHGLRWRAQVITLKLRGKLPDLTWADLLVMQRPGGSYYLEPLIRSPNPFLVIKNPYQEAPDLAEGSRLFGRLCSDCHGKTGTGANGPDLTQTSLGRGSSDWAFYRTIARGMAGTPMRPAELSRREIWQVVAHLQAIRGGGKAMRKPGDQVLFDPVTQERLLKAEEQTAEWLMYSGSYSGRRYRSLAAINRGNVHRLRPRWIHQLTSSEQQHESSPLVVGNTMFVTESPNNVLALDLETGTLKWSYSRDLPEDLKLCCGRLNRGVAILGRVLYLGTLDAHLVALSAVDGNVLWDVEVADYRDGYSITSAPLIVDNRVVVGVAGGEFGIRGFLDGYDAATGERRWRFYTIPEPGQPGAESWQGDSWKRGGGPTWLTGSFDPETGLLYWGVGNPGPDYDGGIRPGDNLYTNSVVALDAKTGTLRWHFQFTPHDEHDWDAAQIPVLADAVFRGRPRKLLLWANKNGFYYILDRTTGEFLLATAFAKQTWASGIDPRGRPIPSPEAAPGAEGTLVYPGSRGATNWWSPSYSPRTGLIYLPTLDGYGAHFFKQSEKWRSGERFRGGAVSVAAEPLTLVRAIEALTGSRRWDYVFDRRLEPGEWRRMGGVLSTGGDLVFAGAGQLFVALDALDGWALWRFNTGRTIQAAPITYSLNGNQYITIVAGRAVLTFGLE